MSTANRTSLALAAVSASAAVLWNAFSRFVAVPIIRAGYAGESLEVVNRVFSGRGEHALQVYLETWAATSDLVLLCIVLAGGVLLVLTRPEVQSRIDRALGPAELPTRPLPGARALAVNGFIAFVVGFSLIEIVFGTEHWPFSNYPMYSWQKADNMRRHRIFGLTRDGRAAPLDVEVHFHPLTEGRLDRAVDQLSGSWPSESGCDLARGLLLQYRTLSDRREHDGPPLNGLSLRRHWWTIQSLGRNVATPDSVTVLCEFVETDATGGR